MAPLTPHWQRPSHPEIQDVHINEAEFTTKSLSRVSLPPFAVFARLAWPPCTAAHEPTYATVQTGRDTHLNLNSDLLYINHSCEPSLIFDTGNMNVLVGPKGLSPGDELTFFYPSTEWSMAQPFDCLCGTPTCRGTISGARDMSAKQLEGIWLNGHIRELLDEQQQQQQQSAGQHQSVVVGNGTDPTTRALRDALAQAEKVVEAARLALRTYVEAGARGDAAALNNGVSKANGLNRRGPTSRELSGEMSGDTVVA
ncbi:post-SET domain-containingprotein [Purpureocillium lavendulum]|uniref:Post-SET domain-containingprotein n=1 Tax=Purpureocillium lavendulum TaxID=1247861 RepID=A0AB34FSF8_9HYPO|nr:post-SET domain-containingprotein [Purpureocillium lavendulum]